MEINREADTNRKQRTNEEERTTERIEQEWRKTRKQVCVCERETERYLNSI